MAGTQSVCRSGPDRAVAKAQLLRGEAGVLSAAVLPNPSLHVEHQQSMQGATDRETIVGISVPLGLGGRRWLLQDAAEARRQQALAEAHLTLFDSALAFRQAYVTASIDRARVELLTAEQAALDAVSTTIAQLAKGGEAASYDKLRQATLARLHQQSLELAKAQELASRTMLEVWTEREVTLPPQSLAVLGGGATVEALKLDGRATPDVESLRARARAAELEARAARRRWVPDLGLFAGYRNVRAGSETGHGVGLGLEIPLTFFDRGQGEAAMADAEQQSARSAVVRVLQGRKVQLKAARANLTRLEAIVSTTEATSRDALLVRDKALQLYRAGEASITELLEAFQVAEAAQLAALEVAREAALGRLAVMRAAGTMFDAALDRECRALSGGAQ
ncbi:MAG TPA: TolC family protein [Polyangiaceae bacterium]|nr:TolC family protein [Polyangiaceae bacterium]